MATNDADKRRLEKISAHAFEHPLDRTALSTLQKVPGLAWFIKRVLGAVDERWFRLLFLSSAVRVTPHQFPRVFELYEEGCRVLDIEKRPELFVAHHYQVNAAAIGYDEPFIVVNSPMLEMMDDNEVQCVLGHELGHIMCGHALYTTMLLVLLDAWRFLIGLPGGIALIGILLALLEWRRKAELSADRAGLLVAQNPEVSYRVNMKLAGGGKADEMSLDEFQRQADDYRSGGDLADGVLKIALLLKASHPFPVLRVSELRRWVESGEYEKILAGDYPRRGDEDGNSWLENIKATAVDYKDSFGSSADPLVSSLRDLGSGAAATGSELVDLFRRVMGLDSAGDSDEKPDT